MAHKKSTVKQSPITGLLAFQEAINTNNPRMLNELDLRLFASVMLGTKDDVSKVIKEGANVNALNLNQLSPLDMAMAYKRKEIVKILEEKGAHPHHEIAPHASVTKKKKPSSKK